MIVAAPEMPKDVSERALAVSDEIERLNVV
jgi:hypothetical protein